MIRSLHLFTFVLLTVLLAACQPDGNVNSSFGTKAPVAENTNTTTTGGSGSGNSSANLVSIVSGDKQTVAIGGTASIPLVVLVLQAPGQPVANETVYFQVVGGASGGLVSSASAITNSSGYAEVYFTGGSTIGDVHIVASAPQGSVNFTTTVTGATGYTLTKTVTNSGDGQVGTINTSLPQKYRVILTDSNGNPVAGQNVRFVSVGLIQGNFSGATFYNSTTNSSGIAESSFMTLNSSAGSHSVNAYLLGDSSVSTTFSALAETPVNSIIDPLKSTLILSSAVVAADAINTVTATLEIRDNFNNLIPNNALASAINVVGNPVMMLQSSWTGPWTYSGTGTYTRVLAVGNISGDINFTASVGAVTLLSAMPTLKLTANSTVDNSKTLLSSTVSPLSTDGVSMTTIVVQLRDMHLNTLSAPGQNVVISTSHGTLVGSMVYHSATGTYRQLLTSPTSVGSGHLTVTLQTINSVAVAGVNLNVPLQASNISQQNSFITISDRVFGGNNVQRLVTVTLKDFNNNGVTAPATVTMTQSVQSGPISGVFLPSSKIASPMGNGVYQINLTSPSNTASACGSGVICTEDISANVLINASTTNLGPLRVQYKDTSIVPSAAHSYIVMDNSSAQAGAGNITGTIYLRSTGLEIISYGGNRNQITLEFTGCTPPDYSVVDNNSGNYSVILNSPASGCAGGMTVKYGGAVIGSTTPPGSATALPFNYIFYGGISLSQSVLTISPSKISGGGTTTATLEIKDAGGSNFPNCSIPTSSFQFLENHAATIVTGALGCTVSGGKAFYSQTIERTSDLDEFYNVSISAQFNSGSGWNTLSSMKTLEITPPNLAFATIDCDNHATFRDKFIYVNGGPLTINGWENGKVPTKNGCSPTTPIRFRKLRIGPSGSVVSTKSTTSNTYGVEFEATEEVHIEAGGKIDVSGLGYSGATANNGMGYGPGNTESVPGSATHGGIGISRWGGTRTSDNLSNRQPIYDSSVDPNDLGSGGGAYNAVMGTSGGGLVRIKTLLAKIDGQILASGNSSSTTYYLGAGGSVKINLGSSGTLVGSGIISAEGGLRPGQPSFGGGGRIAILGDATAFTGQVSTLSGERYRTIADDVYGSQLSHGTVYITKSPSFLSNPSQAATKMNFPWNGMDLGGTNASYFGDIEIANLIVPSGMSISVSQELEVVEIQNAGTIKINHSDFFVKNKITNSGTLTIENLGQTVGTPTEFLDEVVNTGIMDIRLPIKFTDFTNGGSLNVRTPLVIEELTNTAGITFYGGGKITGDNINLLAGSQVSHVALLNGNGSPRVDIQATNSITLAMGGSIDVTAKGYAGGFPYGFSNGFANGASSTGWTSQGANHLSRGGNDNVNPSTLLNMGTIWGNRYSPSTYGGGGASSTPVSGGGVVSLVAPTVNVSGSISVSGGSGGPSNYYPFGGGAGGSLYIHSTNLNFGSSNSLYATGGSGGRSTTGVHCVAGGGAGGLIGVHFKTKTGTPNYNLTGGLTQVDVDNTQHVAAENGLYSETIIP